MKFTEESVMCMEKHFLVEKLGSNGLNMGLHLQAGVEKTVHGVKTHWLSSKEKVPGVAVCKKGHADSHLEHERNNHYWFPWKR